MVCVNLVSQKSSHSWKSLHKLCSFRWLVCNILQLTTEILVVNSQPFCEWSLFFVFNLFQCNSILFIKFWVWGIFRLNINCCKLSCFTVSQLDSYVIKILPANNPSNSTSFDQLHCVLDTINDHSISKSNMIKELWNQSFFLHEFHIQQSLSWLFNGLIESIFKPIRNIHHINDLALKSWVEHVSLIQIILEICTTSKHQTCNVTLVVGDECLGSNLTHLSEIIVTFLFSETSEYHWWLTSLIVFFGELYCELVQNLLGITLKCCIKGARPINDNKSEWWLSNEELLLQVVKIKLALATVNGQVDWLEWLKVAYKFFISSWVLIHYSTTEQNESILGSSLI